MKKIAILLGLLVLCATSGFAQKTDPSSLEREDYDDGQLEMLRNKQWNDLRTSGEEKNLAKIEVNGLKAMKAMANRSMFKSLGSAAWQQVTAGNQDGHNTGRVRDVAADPNNEKKVYVATASGGVWKTDDISQTPPNWVDLSSRMPSLRASAIAVAPGEILFCGTGESEGDGFVYNSQQVGVGILRSKDGGNNWDIVDNGKAGKAVSQIIIDATNPQRIYAATTGGLLKSEDGGDTWNKLNDASNSLPGTNITSISYSPLAPNRLYATSTGKIMYSSDYGVHWIQPKTSDGLPGSMSRITLACSPSSPNLIYASIGTSGTSAARNCFLGTWSSSDSGVTWTKMMQFNPSAGATSSNRNPLGMQQWWCNALAAHPTSSNQIFIGGLDIYRSTDGGKNLNPVTQGNQVTSQNYAHVDIHRLVFIGKTVYSCADGGLASSASPYGSWRTDINVGISALQFVGADADKDFNFVVGGCQDNNTNKAYVNSSTEFHNTRGGDGGKCLVAWDDSNIVYTTYIGSTLYKSLKAGDDNTFSSNLIEGNTALYSDPINGGGGEGITDAYAAYEISSDGATIAYGGRTHVWVSFTGGSDNLPNMSDKSISARFNGIAMSLDGSHMWAGSGSSIFRTTDGVSWTATQLDKPSGTLAGVTVDPTNNNNVYVVAGGTGGTGKYHFFKSTDGGVTFTHPTTTTFPDINCVSIAVKPENGYIFVGTDKGVIYSMDGGVTWDPLMNNFPAALVTSLKIKGTDHNKLLAGTYGRGVHWLDLSSLGVTKPGPDQSGLKFDAVQPNPIKDGAATLSFTLPQSGQSQVTLYDVLGKEIKILDKNYYQAGNHSIRVNTTGLTSGTYFATLVYGGKAITQKLIIE